MIGICFSLMAIGVPFVTERRNPQNNRWLSSVTQTPPSIGYFQFINNHSQPFGPFDGYHGFMSISLSLALSLSFFCLNVDNNASRMRMLVNSVNRKATNHGDQLKLVKESFTFATFGIRVNVLKKTTGKRNPSSSILLKKNWFDSI